MSPARSQLRIAVCTLGILAIIASSIFEPPGTVEAIGYVVVLVVLVLLIRKERGRLKGSG